MDAQLQKKKEKGGVVRVLEIAAGCGVHTLHFCTQLANNIAEDAGSVDGMKKKLVWMPTDPDAPSRASTNERRSTFQSSSIEIQAAESLWLGDDSNTPVFDSVDVIVCINMIHISPWEATLGLMKLAGECLAEDGIMYCYGPYKEGGTAAESNL